MTRLHYPREFRQQSPAVWVKTRVFAQNGPRVDPSAVNVRKSGRMAEQGPRSEPLGSVPG